MRPGALVCGVALLTASAASADIRVTTENNPPLNMPGKGGVTGISTEIVKAIFARAEVGYTIDLLPAPGGLEVALKHRDTCFYSALVTPERQKLMAFVAPIASNDWMLFGRAGAAPLDRLEEARGRKIAGPGDYAAMLMLRREGYDLVRTADAAAAVAALANGSADLLAAGLESGPAVAKAAGVAVQPVFRIRDAPMGLACNRDTDPAVIRKLRDALAALRQE